MTWTLPEARFSPAAPALLLPRGPLPCSERLVRGMRGQGCGRDADVGPSIRARLESSLRMPLSVTSGP